LPRRKIKRTFMDSQNDNLNIGKNQIKKDGKLIFPSGFYWGSATSSHQVEGNNHNDWSEWEKENAERLAKEARNYWQKWQQEKFPEMFEPENYISGRVCDHYNRFREDFDIARSLGHNAHRFSIEWSRIEPEEGKFDEKEIEHYRRVISALKERELEPFVTLWHFTNPLWIRDIGGWENKKTIDYFLRYAGKIIEELGEEVRFWLPINEPTVYAGQGYVLGVFPPQVKSQTRGNRVLKNLIKAHKKAYRLLHQKLGESIMVGSAHNLHYHVPYQKWSPWDWLATKIFNYFRDIRQLNLSVDCEDFIGLNYYYRDTVKFVLKGGRYGAVDIRNPNEEISDLGWDIFPEGIYHVLKYLKKYKKPIYITENGIADTKDEKRAKFIKEHLKWMHKAISEGADVRGYFHWSLLDNFEWDKGFWPRFGLVEVDYKTLERKIRPSAWEYAKICKDNGFELS
jgi:beta-glucosidase